ncbi:MAG: shikimate kinase [Zetaproteobacteria bacterium]|nr:MAG: shikimate kinase [Zetaproteobacteria bacterium]
MIGLMGAGKSSVGRALAAALGLPFLDLDAYIVAQQGCTIPEIFAARGEQGFRAIESAALQAVLGRRCVLATGGGIVLQARNRALLRAHPPVIWLRAHPAVLATRIAGDANRPLIAGGDALARLTELAAERDPLYAQCADLVVDVDALDVRQVVRRILTLLARND